jgi:hypothetical protein
MAGRHKDEEGYRLIIGVWAGIPAPMPGAKAAAPKKLREKAIREFQSTLHSLVDRWIDSGRRGDDDRPWARSVQHGATESIQMTLLGFWKRHPPSVSFMGETQVILTQSQARESDWIHLAEQPENYVLERARDYAIGLFAPLVDSPSRYRISKCAECYAYFMKKRMPKKGIAIRGGSYCEREQCKRAANIRRVNGGRGKRLVTMIQWAADAVSEWKPERRFGSKADWVVGQVRKKQPRWEKPIEVNWYTLHVKEIEAVVGRRSHAKS